MTRAEKIASKKLDNEIARIFKIHCSYAIINLMDIPKVWEEGRRAQAAGEDLTQAIIAIVRKIQKNPPMDKLPDLLAKLN